MVICQARGFVVDLLRFVEFAALQACLVGVVRASGDTKYGINANGNGSSWIFPIDLVRCLLAKMILKAWCNRVVTAAITVMVIFRGSTSSCAKLKTESEL
jgi:hypothetical protein